MIVKDDEGKEYVYDLPVNTILLIPKENLEEIWDKCFSCSEAEKTDVFHKYIQVKKGFRVSEGDIIAKIPKEKAKVRDIVGGLPRVEELLEAREPKNKAIISEIDGIVRIYEDAKEITIINPKEQKTQTYKVPENTFVIVKMVVW